MNHGDVWRRTEQLERAAWRETSLGGAVRATTRAARILLHDSFHRAWPALAPNELRDLSGMRVAQWPLSLTDFIEDEQ